MWHEIKMDRLSAVGRVDHPAIRGGDGVGSVVMKIDASGLKPDRDNANEGTQRGRGLLEKSLRKLGAGRSILVDADDNVIAGNKTLEIAAQIDLPVRFIETDGNELIAVKRTDLHLYDDKDTRGRKLAYADNKIAELDLSWKPEAIAADFAPLDLGEWGFVDETPAGDGDAEPQIDRAAELNEKWQVKTGDLWKIGEHRLLCGDSTVRADVERVTAGEKAVMCFTSPPYAAQRDYKIGDFDWLELMTGFSEQAIFACKENASILVNLGLVHVDGKVFRYWDLWIDWMEENEQPLYGWYVWDKQSGLMGDWRGRLAPAHEWIFHFANKPNRANKTAPTKYAEMGVTHYKKDKVGLREKDGKMTGFTMAGEQVNATKVIDSVIRCQPQRGGIPGHLAPFSVEFASTLIEVYSQSGERVYEPFCGSGTSIVSCQNLGRISLSIELEPIYCAVILERMATAFPELTIERL